MPKQKKRRKQKKQPKVIKLSPEKVAEVLGKLEAAKVDDEDYRHHILTQLNRGECRNGLARSIYHGQRGEIRKKYREGQEDQLSALGLVTNAIALWNTIYMQSALGVLEARGEIIAGEDVKRLSLLASGHINVLGHYSFSLPQIVEDGHLRPLNELEDEIIGN